MLKRLLLSFPLLALPLAAQPTLVGHIAGNGAVASSPINATGANAIFICGWDGNIPTDSSGNTYTKINSVSFGNELDLWVKFGPAVSASMTFNGNDTNNAISVVAVSGIASGPDQAVNSPSGTTVLNVTPTKNTEFVMSCGLNENGGATLTNSTLTNLDTATNAGANRYTTAAYQIQTTAAAATSTWSATWGNGNATNLLSFYSVVNPAPLIETNPTPLTELVAGVGGSIPLTATGGVQPYTFTLNSGTLPANCSIVSPNLVCISAVAASVTTGIVIKVTDATATTALSTSLTLPIAASAVSISSSSCPSTGTQYVAYPAGCGVHGSGGIPPYTYSYNTDRGFNYAPVPPGLTLNSSTGTITGINYAQGYYGTLYLVSDAYGATAGTVVTLHLAGDNGWMASVYPSDSAFHIYLPPLPVDNSPIASQGIYGGSHMQLLFGSGAFGVGVPNGIPILKVPAGTPTVSVTTVVSGCGLFSFTSGPIPAYMPIEGTQNNSNPDGSYPGDGHASLTILDGGGNPFSLYEMWQAKYNSGPWLDCSNALWANVQSSGTNAYVPNPPGHGAPDAAGLPIGPLVLNADEVTVAKVVKHPTRFTINQNSNYHLWPAVASAGTGFGGCTGGYFDPTFNNLLSYANPPTSCSAFMNLGVIWRLKASVPNPGCAATSPQSAVILQGFRDYGIILADNGNGFYIIGTPDARWDDTDLGCLTNLTLSDFEAVNVQGIAANWPNSTQTTVTPPPTGPKKITSGHVKKTGSQKE